MFLGLVENGGCKIVIARRWGDGGSGTKGFKALCSAEMSLSWGLLAVSTTLVALVDGFAEIRLVEDT